MMRRLNRTDNVCHSGAGRNPRRPSGQAPFGSMDPGLRRGDKIEYRGGGLSRRGGGFTLVEILIVVLLLGILAAIVIPQFTGATDEARENVLRETLRNLRTQINVYRAHHRDTSPGYPDGDEDQAPTEAAFIEQMTQATDVYGDPTAAVKPFGPYLRSMPVNPLNNSAEIEIIPDGDDSDLTGDESGGWIFRPEDVKFVADSLDPFDTF